MKIALICPSRGRPHRFKAMVESAQRLAAQPGLMMVYLGLDRADPCFDEYLLEMPHGVTVIVNEVERPVPHLMDWLARQSRGELVMAAADDLLFRTPNWDDLIRAEFAACPDGMLVANTNDLSGSDKVTHFVVTRAWIAAVGVFMSHEFEHFGGDEYVERIGRSVGRVKFMRHVHVEHMHKKYRNPDGTPKGENDETYQSKRRPDANGEGMSDRDKRVMQRLLPEIERAAERVRLAMKAAA